MKEFDNEEEFMRDGGSSAAAKNLWFFECAWEVANKGKYRQKKVMTNKQMFVLLG